MSPPAELSYDEILKYMIEHNGRVTNHELVKHFKVFLTNPDLKDEARSTFKKHVNALANIKTQNNEKWLILKKKYMPTKEEVNCEVINDNKPDEISNIAEESENSQSPPPRPPLPLQLNQDFSILNNLIQDSTKNALVPTDISPSSPNMPPSESKESLVSVQSDDIPPKVHPRRKSSADKVALKTVMPSEHRSSIPNEAMPEMNDTSSTLTPSKSESMLIDSEQTISVRERKQMFNRLASENDILKANKSDSFGHGADEEDRVSLDHKSEGPLDPKQKQWILYAAKGDYHALAKMCKENVKLVKTKDPFTGYTAMHWACKRGDENLVKLLGGAARHIVNERSNGGYTPLHIAMQFQREDVYRLLVEVYDADPNIRDWSGRKPRQYLIHTDTSVSPGSYRKKEGFLRIGSINVRVKRTTEAFSNFLGKDEKLMQPPMSSKVKRRGNTGRRGVGAGHSRSTPSTPDQPRAQMGVNLEGDSDSDSAAGFHAAWKQQRASHCT